MRMQIVGAVAQLGERYVRNVEVRGSIPLGSTIFETVTLSCRFSFLKNNRPVLSEKIHHLHIGIEDSAII